MAGIKVNVHPQFGFDFGRFYLNQIVAAEDAWIAPPGEPVHAAPQLEIQQAADPGGGQPTEPNALMFIDPDGSMHVFVLSDVTKRNLIAKLTGGIVMPDGVG